MTFQDSQKNILMLACCFTGILLLSFCLFFTIHYWKQNKTEVVCTPVQTIPLVGNSSENEEELKPLDPQTEELLFSEKVLLPTETIDLEKTIKKLESPPPQRSPAQNEPN